jgi:hypothetical protein
VSVPEEAGNDMGSVESGILPHRRLWMRLRKGISAAVGPDDAGSPTSDIPSPLNYVPLNLFERLRDTSWAQRRVEEISVTGRRAVQRQVWVIVNIHPDKADERKGNERTAFVPLNRFDKKLGVPERVFHVLDTGGTIVPALAPKDRDRRLAEALVAAVDELLSARPESWRKPLRQELRDVVFETDQAKMTECLRSLESRLAEIDDCTERESGLFDVFRKVASQRLLLIPVKADGQSHCFFFEYISSKTLEKSRDDGRLFDRFTAHMGWRPVTFKFEVPGAALTPLFQVRFRAPEGVAISGSRIESPAGCDHGDGDTTLHQVDHASGGARLEDAKAFFYLRPHRLGLLRNGLLACMIISAVLIAGAVFTLPLDNAAKQADAAAALLLAAPSFFLLQAVQSQEHAVVSSMLSGLRRALLAVGLAAFVAAVLLVTSKEPGTPLHVVWSVLAATAGLGTVSLLVAYLFGSQPPSGSEDQPPDRDPAVPLLSRRGVQTALWLSLWGAGALAWIAFLLLAATIALVVVTNVTLQLPFTQPHDVVARIVVLLVAVGTASPAIASFLGSVRRAARPSSSPANRS